MPDDPSEKSERYLLLRLVFAAVALIVLGLGVMYFSRSPNPNASARTPSDGQPSKP